MNRYINILGRILFTSVFFMSGIGKLMHTSDMVGYAASKGLPSPTAAIFAAAAVEILGSIAIILGFHAKKVAVLWALFLVPVTVLFHSSGGMNDQVNLLKNLTIIGAAIMLALNGSGALSIDNRKKAP